MVYIGIIMIITIVLVGISITDEIHKVAEQVNMLAIILKEKNKQ